MRKVAVVTGGARGIGRACAHALAERGYDLVLVDLLTPEMARTKAELEVMGRQALTFEADVADHACAKSKLGMDGEWQSGKRCTGYQKDRPNRDQCREQLQCKC